MEQPFSRQTFRKEEKLCSKTAIEKLFLTGKVFYINPIKVLIASSPSREKPVVRVLISVPKKYLRHATDRNRMKRLLREAYRRSKQQLIQQVNLSQRELSIALIYTGKQLLSYEAIETSIINILEKILQQESKFDEAEL